MKEIKIVDKASYLRPFMDKVEVDDTDLTFINGIAVATGIMSIRGTKDKIPCVGVINEDYKEAFCDSDKTTMVPRNLMFLPYNKSITRFGDNDFIIEVSCSDGDRCYWTEFRHVRLVNGIPTLINQNIGQYVKTPFDSCVITRPFKGNRLYGIAEGEFLTRLFKQISLVDATTGDCLVFDELSLQNSGNGVKCCETLAFQLNILRKEVTSIVSSVDCALLNERTMSLSDYEEFRAKRMEELSHREEKYNALVRSLRNPKQQILEG